MTGVVPGSAPLPAQRSQVDRDVHPHADRRAGVSVGEGDPSDGRRRRRRGGDGRVRSPGAEEPLTEEGREDVSEVAEVESRWPGTPPPEPGVTVAVVGVAALWVGEDLVRLGNLPKALLRVRRIGDVGMELAREPAERALDLVIRRVAWDAEELVVVLSP